MRTSTVAHTDGSIAAGADGPAGGGGAATAVEGVGVGCDRTVGGGGTTAGAVVRSAANGD
ncbi:hypothetical protein TR51_18485 [Kitasatospora griseola]|uniref:Uncharacterized protein n=1 Tax=Kitasatospora griseola TaxID=2064 RepID=A0A0D0PZR0_KITGR|nr:hypothetical protein [Kitasatospora griseola]KIQ65747.1 hypothetical protein TR51_18485 [Kitasatospora griseola]